MAAEARVKVHDAHGAKGQATVKPVALFDRNLFINVFHGHASCKATGKNPRSFVAPGVDQVLLTPDRSGPNS
jgi:hypothetical protein